MNNTWIANDIAKTWLKYFKINKILRIQYTLPFSLTDRHNSSVCTPEKAAGGSKQTCVFNKGNQLARVREDAQKDPLFKERNKNTMNTEAGLRIRFFRLLCLHQHKETFKRDRLIKLSVLIF